MKTIVRILVILAAGLVVSGLAFGFVASGLASRLGSGVGEERHMPGGAPPSGEFMRAEGGMGRPMREGRMPRQPAGAAIEQAQFREGARPERGGGSDMHHGDSFNISSFTWFTLRKNLGIILAISVSFAVLSWLAGRIRNRPRRPAAGAA